MKSLLTIAFTLAISFASHAASTTTVVRCWVPKFEKDSVFLKIQNGRMIRWDKNHVARPDAKSIFGLLSEPINSGSLESVRFGRGKNKFAFVTVITTADSLTVGVSPDFKRGFYSYRDLGSGNGNEYLALACHESN